jgi:hypothetical protein
LCGRTLLLPSIHVSNGIQIKIQFAYVLFEHLINNLWFYLDLGFPYIYLQENATNPNLMFLENWNPNLKIRSSNNAQNVALNKLRPPQFMPLVVSLGQKW